MTTTEAGEAFVSHFGVKGMHWGVRMEERRAAVETRNREARPAQPVRTHDSIGPSKHKKTSISAKGGEDHPAHMDAVKAAESQQKLKKSGHAALSNQELRDLVTRRQLEDQASVATSSRGRKFAQRQLEIQGQQQIQKGLASTIAKKTAKAGLAVA